MGTVESRPHHGARVVEGARPCFGSITADRSQFFSQPGPDEFVLVVPFPGGPYSIPMVARSGTSVVQYLVRRFLAHCRLIHLARAGDAHAHIVVGTHVLVVRQ